MLERESRQAAFGCGLEVPRSSTATHARMYAQRIEANFRMENADDVRLGERTRQPQARGTAVMMDLEQVLPAIDYTVPPHRMEEHYIALVKKGRGKKIIGSYEFPIGDNLLMIVPRRMVQSGCYDPGEMKDLLL